MSHHRRLFLYLATLIVCFAIPGLARAANYTVCARLTTSFENVGGGEDYITDADGPYSALYQRVIVLRAGFPYYNGYLSDTGCATFASNFSDSYTVYFFSEVQVPRTDNGAQTNIGKITDSSGNLAQWVFGHSFVGTSKTFDLSANWASNLVVATRQALYRFSNGVSSKTFLVKDQACPTDSSNSCNSGTYSSNTSTAYIHPDHNPRKFAIGHELGHSLVAHYFGGNPWPNEAGAYDYNGGGTSCQWSGAGSHAMHSMEYAAGALLEGFPQFYATYVFNSEATTDAYFYYYKDGTGVTDVDMETGPTGGVTAYMDNTCTGTLTGKGVELDWSRQFWDYRTNSGTKPSNSAILSQLNSAFGTPASWHTVVNYPSLGDFDNTVNRMAAGLQAYDAVFSTGFETRWNNTDNTNGINYPDP